MKKLVSILAIVGVIGTAALMTGCGGGGGDGHAVAQNGFAPASVANKMVTLTENGQSRDVQFAVSGNNFTQFQTGTTNVVAAGTFQWTQQAANNGQLILTTTDQTGTNQVTYVLTFTSANSGTYTFTTSGGATGSGTFSNFQDITSNNTGGGTTGGTTAGNTGGNTGGTTGGNTGGVAPASLAGHAIDFTATGAGNERLTFAASGNQVTSDAVNPPNNVATYTYTPVSGGNTANLVVNFPNGDNYNLTMTFTDSTHGTWSGTQHFGGADHTVPAGSSFTFAN
jgi:hypothetical protein